MTYAEIIIKIAAALDAADTPSRTLSAPAGKAGSFASLGVKAM